MFREIVQNSLDEIARGTTIDKNVIVSYNAIDHLCIVEDNGQGIPIDKLVPVFSILHSSSNYHKHTGDAVTSGKNGMGATITNFLSKVFTVESYRMDGSAGKVEFNEGHLTNKALQNIKCPKGKHGLITSFIPSDMMGEITIDDVQIENFLRQLCYIGPLGVKITYNCISPTGMKRRVIIENTKGIYHMLPWICEKPLMEPVHFSDYNGDMGIEVLFTYDMKNMDDPEILSFANMSPTKAGTHVDGFLDGLIKYMRDYMNKIYLANNKKLQVTAQDIRTGLRAVVSCKSIHPLYTGQSKEIYSEVNMKKYSSDISFNAIEEWTKQSPDGLQKVGKYLKDVCEIRMKSDNEKIKISDKYTASAITGYPQKYKKANGNGPFELFITEG